MITKIKDHVVKHGDVMKLGNELMQGEKAHIFYSDPPWGVGNLRYWQTMNNKMTGAERTDQDLDLFLNKIFTLAANYTKPNGIIFIEYGVKWESNILELAKQYGLKHLGTALPQYRSGSRLLPLHLHLFSKTAQNLPNGYLETIKDTYGYTTLRNAVAPFVKAGEIILDPCCGMGYSAQLCVDNQMRFRGNELNAKRLEKTKARLNK